MFFSVGPVKWPVAVKNRFLTLYTFAGTQVTPNTYRTRTSYLARRMDAIA